MERKGGRVVQAGEIREDALQVCHLRTAKRKTLVPDQYQEERPVGPERARRY